MKEWIKDTNILKGTLQSLYNIMWGECIKLMRNKFLAGKYFKSAIEVPGDTKKLPKEVRGIVH